MIPPNQGSNIPQDSSINMTPRENCYISGYEGVNEISQDVTERERTVIFVVKCSDLDGEMVTCFSLYKFAMLNSPETSHLVTTLISPNW